VYNNHVERPRRNPPAGHTNEAPRGRKDETMNIYVGTHPVYVSHVKEVEDMMYFVADLQQKMLDKEIGSGEQYDCLVRIRAKCRDLLLKMYAEDDSIMLVDDNDFDWLKKIVGFADKIPKEQAYA
jgi:hypothetical protein